MPREVGSIKVSGDLSAGWGMQVFIMESPLTNHFLESRISCCGRAAGISH
jgi:hypothetical protein